MLIQKGEKLNKAIFSPHAHFFPLFFSYVFILLFTFYFSFNFLFRPLRSHWTCFLLQIFPQMTSEGLIFLFSGGGGVVYTNIYSAAATNRVRVLYSTPFQGCSFSEHGIWYPLVQTFLLQDIMWSAWCPSPQSAVLLLCSKLMLIHFYQLALSSHSRNDFVHSDGAHMLLVFNHVSMVLLIIWYFPHCLYITC
jgi:hypothetical protein